MKAVDYSRKTGLASTRQICNCMYLQRDAYYKCRERIEQRKSIEAILISFNFTFVYSQDVIELKNPSFEGLARCCKSPSGWESCGDRS